MAAQSPRTARGGAPARPDPPPAATCPTTGHDPAPGGSPRLRADARDNRHRIMEAAREAFSARGTDVPMVAIARRAGVGTATLYRRFPTREALVTAVFADEMTVCAGMMEEALADPDPWRGFCSVITGVCAMQAADRGFTDAFLAAFPATAEHDDRRAFAETSLAELVRRAKESGRLRADFAQEDLALVLLANSGVVTDDPATTEAASRRLVAHLLRSFAVAEGDARPLPPPPPIGLGQLYGRPAG